MAMNKAIPARPRAWSISATSGVRVAPGSRAVWGSFSAFGHSQAAQTPPVAIKVSNMATLALDDLGWGPHSAKNVISQKWAPSKPVAHAASAFTRIHLAAARTEGRSQSNIELFSLIYSPTLLPEIVQLSELYRQAIIRAPTIEIEDEGTIQFALK